MSLRYPKTDSELKNAVRGETSYEDTTDELPSSQLDVVVERSKGRMELETGSNNWYSDDGLGFALVAYTSMRAKAAVENIPLSSYNIGDEQVSFEHASPEDSHQLQQWAEDVNVGLNASNADSAQGPQLADSAGYIGGSYAHEDPH